MRIIFIFLWLAFASLMLYPTAVMADEHESGNHNSKNCDTSPVKHAYHDTTLLIGDYCDLTNPIIPNYRTEWTLPDAAGSGQMWATLNTIRVICSDIPSSADSIRMFVDNSSFQVRNFYEGTFSYFLKSLTPECPDREGDTIKIMFLKECNPNPVKYAFHDTTLHIGDQCCLPPPLFTDYLLEWHIPLNPDITQETIASYEEGLVITCLSGSDSAHLTMELWDIKQTTIPSNYTGDFYYNIISKTPLCTDREGDTIHITFSIICDSTPVKLPFHDTIFCESEGLLLVATDEPHTGFRTRWSNLSTKEAYIHEGDAFFITEPGVYAFDLHNMITDGCHDREGDTVNVVAYPRPQAFLPQDTLQTCSGLSGALTFESEQPLIDFRWNDGDSVMPYRFAYRGDTLDKRFCVLSNSCSDTLIDSVIVRFLPPYIYLGGDSVMGCHDDSLLFDMAPYNIQLPNYDSMHFVWMLRGDTVSDGRPGDLSDRLWVYFPQDTGLLTVQAFYPDPNPVPDAPMSCPVTADTIKLQFYIWPDIDFFVRNGDTTICHYDSIELFLDRDSLVFSPDAYYIWLFDSVPYDTSADKTFYAAKPGVYTTTGVNYCSRHSESFVLTQHPKERITVILRDTTVCPETPISLDPTLPYAGNRYVWLQGSTDEDDEGYNGDDDSGNYMEFRNPGEIPEDLDFDLWPWEASAALWLDTPGVYTLYVMDSVGCMGHSAFTFTVEECDPQFETPNVFTPNGDGINDVFKLKTMVKLFEFEIRLFNRWGNQIYAYKGEPEGFSWDGTLHGNGQGAPDGVYFYVATYKDYQGKKKKQSGSVTILR